MATTTQTQRSAAAKRAAATRSTAAKRRSAAAKRAAATREVNQRSPVEQVQYAAERAVLIPVGAAALLDNISPDDLPAGIAGNWTNLREALRTLIQLKTQTITAFNK